MEFSAFVEHFAEGFLNGDDIFTNADFPTKFFLDIRCCRQVISVNMGLNQPFNFEALFLDIRDNRIGVFIGNLARRIVDIHNAIDNRAGIGIGIFDHIGDCIGRRIKERLNLGLNIHIYGEGGHFLAP